MFSNDIYTAIKRLNELENEDKALDNEFSKRLMDDETIVEALEYEAKEPSLCLIFIS